MLIKRHYIALQNDVQHCETGIDETDQNDTQHGDKEQNGTRGFAGGRYADCCNAECRYAEFLGI